MAIRIIKAEGGLGSQMLQVALYLSLEEKGEIVFFDLCNYTEDYECHNGWEVEKVFPSLKLKILKKDKIRPMRKFLIRSERYLMNKFLRIEKKSYYEKICSNFWKKYNLKYFINNYGKKIKIDKVYSNVGGKYDSDWYEKNKNTYYTETYSSEKYFKNAEKIIRKNFKFPSIEDPKNLEIMEKIKDRQSVSIHIRRGDYVGNNVLGGVIDLDYYKKAIKYLESKIDFPLYVIFSDDIYWCQNNLNLKNKDIIYVNWNKGKNSYNDMQLMSLCKHNIIPNSSFSWWGAWLNNNPQKIVIAPEKWYSESSRIPSDDIVPENWIKIKNY